MARVDFINQLQAMGYVVEDMTDNRLKFRYSISVGRFSHQEIWLGFVVAEDFPLTPPSGPHVWPRLLPLHPNDGTPHPKGSVHASPEFGDNWEYWSRPFPDWSSTDRTVRAYMGFIRRLLDTQ